MNNYWQQTISFASTNGRKEFGFWVYLDTNDGTYHCEDIPRFGVM